jgi:hypothetical protein
MSLLPVCGWVFMVPAVKEFEAIIRRYFTEGMENLDY